MGRWVPQTPGGLSVLRGCFRDPPGRVFGPNAGSGVTTMATTSQTAALPRGQLEVYRLTPPQGGGWAEATLTSGLGRRGCRFGLLDSCWCPQLPS